MVFLDDIYLFAFLLQLLSIQILVNTSFFEFCKTIPLSKFCAILYSIEIFSISNRAVSRTV